MKQQSTNTICQTDLKLLGHSSWIQLQLSSWNNWINDIFQSHPWLIVHLPFIQCWGPSNSLCGAFKPATDCVNVRWAACCSLAAHSNLLVWVGYHVFCDVSPRRNHCAGQPAGWVDWFTVDSRSWCDMDVTLSLHVSNNFGGRTVDTSVWQIVWTWIS